MTPGIYLGVAHGKKAFLVYNPLTRKVNESRDVHFFKRSDTESECVTIKVESHNSLTHVVVPQDEGVGSGNMGEGDEDNRVDSPLSNDNEPEPEPSPP